MGEFGRFEVVIFVLLGLVIASTNALKMNFYSKTCPKAEQIVQDYVNEHIKKVPSLAAALLRMQFHDCFVRGCDASVLLNSTKKSNKKPTEKSARPNLTIRGFDFIDRVKSLLEEQCPQVVSCADIIALVARDAINVTGGPYWLVPTGRRDGKVSIRSEASANIPPPSSNLTALEESFKRKGLDALDLVVLSGAHTIGMSHCTSFSNRLFNFTGKGDLDPNLDSEYAAKLKQFKYCPTINSLNIVEMDPGSFRTFDLSYYKLLHKRRGLFVSDAALLTGGVTKSIISQILSQPLDKFNQAFAYSMEKMGRIEVMTGNEGEIRKNCAFVNS